VRRIVTDGYRRARQILEGSVEKLRSLAKALLEFEVLSGEEVDAILEGRPIQRPPTAPAASAPEPSKEKKKEERPTRSGLFPRPVLKEEPEKA
jgi:cell division protease FtsH